MHSSCCVLSFRSGQVATTGQEAGGSGSGSGMTTSELSTPGHARGPQLVRARSGPATLSHAVFEMLFNELKSVLGGLRAARTVRAKERARVKAVKVKKAREEAVAANAVAEAATTVEGSEAKDVSVELSSSAIDAVEVSAVAESSLKATVNAAAETAGTSGFEADSWGVPSTMADFGGEAESGGVGAHGQEDEERMVFERLADMQDDLACLTLSRELQVCEPRQGRGPT